VLLLLTLGVGDPAQSHGDLGMWQVFGQGQAPALFFNKITGKKHWFLL
jgi:hypothetical protein